MASPKSITHVLTGKPYEDSAMDGVKIAMCRWRRSWGQYPHTMDTGDCQKPKKWRVQGNFSLDPPGRSWFLCFDFRLPAFSELRRLNFLVLIQILIIS